MRGYDRLVTSVGLKRVLGECNGADRASPGGARGVDWDVEVNGDPVNLSRPVLGALFFDTLLFPPPCGEFQLLLSLVLGLLDFVLAHCTPGRSCGFLQLRLLASQKLSYLGATVNGAYMLLVEPRALILIEVEKFCKFGGIEVPALNAFVPLMEEADTMRDGGLMGLRSVSRY